jgi:hypothetical protein
MKNVLIKKIEDRFKSGNSVPVERVHITVDEWRELRAMISVPSDEPEIPHYRLSSSFEGTGYTG